MSERWPSLLDLSMRGLCLDRDGALGYLVMGQVVGRMRQNQIQATLVALGSKVSSVKYNISKRQLSQKPEVRSNPRLLGCRRIVTNCATKRKPILAYLIKCALFVIQSS